MTQAANKTCQGCKVEITPAEIIDRRAGLVQGVLLCAKCVDAKRRQALQGRPTAPPTASPPAAQLVSPPPPKAPEDELISLVSDDEMPTSKSQMIRSFAEGSTLGGAHNDSKLKRKVAGPNEPATRTRTFHGKLTDAGLANMDDIMNEWLDQHPDIFVKHVTSSIGIFESKTKETHIFISIFY